MNETVERSNEQRAFPIGDVLSITTGRLVAKEGMGAVYEILNFLTGDNLYTHVLPRAAEFCRPALLKRFPQLKAVGDHMGEMLSKRIHDGLSNEERDEIEAEVVELACLEEGVPPELDLEPVDDWESKNALVELLENMGDALTETEDDHGGKED